MSRAPVFPPLMKGLATGPADPMPIAVDQARRGVDAGLIAWSITEDRLRAALILAPETPLEPAMAGVIACGLGMQNALGALAPPETAVHLDWTGALRLNGGHAGGFHIAASTRDPAALPDWVIVGVELTRHLPEDMEPGDTPDRTSLGQEGCGEIDMVDLLEAWARHSLLWLNTLEGSGGRAQLYREWQGVAWKFGDAITLPLDGSRVPGQFLGVDENFGMLFKVGDAPPRLLPMTRLIEEV